MGKVFRSLSVVAFAIAALLAIPARTADHRDAPGVNEDPRADINDIYAFVNPNSGNVVLAMTVNPFQIGGAPGIAFGADVLYRSDPERFRAEPRLESRQRQRPGE